MTNTHYSFDTLLDDVYANKGGTYYLANIRGGKTVIGEAGFNHGYYVATENNEVCISADMLEVFDIKSILIDYIKSKASLLIENSLYLGFWIADSGRLYIDITEHIDNLDRAIATGIDRKQLAIWDIAGDVEIDLR